MLTITDLHVSVEGKEILKGINLKVKPGEVHAIMGPNGSGKSTLAYALAGHPFYEVTQGQVTLGKENILDLSPDARAKAGIFLAFQYPVSVSGVSVQNFLRAAKSALTNGSGPKLSVSEFRLLLLKEAETLGITPDLLKRSLNDGFSGGEKKRVEILQMNILNPKIALLDETDSGLDIDSIKLAAKGIKKSVKDNQTGCLVITHYQRILEYLKPDFVHVIIAGKIVKSGGSEIVTELEKSGYKDLFA